MLVGCQFDIWGNVSELYNDDYHCTLKYDKNKIISYENSLGDYWNRDFMIECPYGKINFDASELKHTNSAYKHNYIYVNYNAEFSGLNEINITSSQFSLNTYSGTYSGVYGGNSSVSGTYSTFIGGGNNNYIMGVDSYSGSTNTASGYSSTVSVIIEPVTGQLNYSTSDNSMSTWNGAEWVAI